MLITIAETTFDRVDYDAEHDVLYLAAGDPGEATWGDATPEGHNARYASDGRLVGLTLIGPRRALERDGELAITLPRPTQRVPAAVLRLALV